MTTCNATPTWGARLRTARRALGARQLDVALVWGISTSAVSAYESGKLALPAHLEPRVIELEEWAAGEQAAHEITRALAEVKDRELAQQLERMSSGAVRRAPQPVPEAVAATPASAPQPVATTPAPVTSWQAMGSRPVALIEGAQAGPVQMEIGGPAAGKSEVRDPYATTIDWRAFVVDVDGQRGVSLRALVQAGLYSRYEDALSAAQKAGVMGFSAHPKNPNGGRPGHDLIITDLRSAQKFALRARTEVGEQIADLILDHHDELQKLIAGDQTAHQRLADVQPAAAAALPDDPVLAVLVSMAHVRTEQLADRARIERLERESEIRAEHDRRMIRAMEALPAPTVEARQLSTRKALVALVQDVGFRAGGGEAYHDRWTHLYAQFEHRYSIDLKTRAKNAGLKSPLDYAEQHGHLDDLYALAVSIWRERDDAQA